MKVVITIPAHESAPTQPDAAMRRRNTRLCPTKCDYDTNYNAPGGPPRFLKRIVLDALLPPNAFETHSVRAPQRL